MAPPFTKPHIEPSLKRVRVLFGGQWIVDTKAANLVWEHPYYPTYFFSSGEIKKEYLRPTSFEDQSQESYDVVVGDKVAKQAVIKYGDGAGDLSGLLKVIFASMDAWFEEEEQIFVHPKDPYKRVDVFQSSRHVRVEVDGVEVANTSKPRLLFETGLPGVASYYSVRSPDNDKLVENIVWWYRSPLAECIDIKGFVAFYDEKVDVWVDGEKLERPKTLFF